MDRNIIDYTALSTYLSCPRKFYFRFVRDWETTDKSVHLVFGLAWHSALEEFYRAIHLDISDDQLASCCNDAFLKKWDNSGGLTFDYDAVKPKNPGRAKQMIYDYVRQFRPIDRQYEVLGIEESFSFQPDPSLPTFIGRRDADLYDHARKRIVIQEHKTTKYSNDVYFAQFDTSLQPEGYIASAKLLSEGNFPIVQINVASIQAAGTKFFRQVIAKSDVMVERYLYELTRHLTTLVREYTVLDHFRGLAASKDERFPMPIFLRNPGQTCTAFFQKCPYFDVCNQWVNPDAKEMPDIYIHSPWDPRNPDKADS